MANGNSWINQAWLYIPQDRRAALALGKDLPENVEGAALFADVSGFTPLTEALTDALGLRRGAEELPLYLNAIYDALIGEVERFGGSVIGFAGDAITCWFEGALSQEGAPSQKAVPAPEAVTRAVLRAITCALAMQSAMRSFASVPVPGREPVALAVKISVACGPARRFLVGDPAILLYDILAGETLYRMAEGEHHANRGDILLDEAAVGCLGDLLDISEWRQEQAGTGPGRCFAVLGGLKTPAAPTPWPGLQPGQLTEAQVRPWVHQPVVERLQAGMGEFLTELRPTVAVFLRFSGIDYDNDPQAGSRLNEYIRAVQNLLEPTGGNLLEITVGDKGSYLYINFGACVSHEDDSRRAVLTALKLSKLHTGLAEGATIQIGVTRGTMRTGEYGGNTRRSYGALGDDVNLAARLMSRAAAGEVLISRRVHKELTDTEYNGTGFQKEGLTFEPRPPIQLKGKAEPVPVFAVLGVQVRRAIRLQEPSYSLPMVGREKELGIITEKIDLALGGQGQVVGITAEAGMGKSRLVAEAIRLARTKGLEGYGGACQSDGTQTAYLVWKPIWSAFFDLDPEAPPRRQIRNLEGEVEDLAPDRLEAVPLLGELLGLAIPENEFTQALEPKHRLTALEALLLDILRARAKEAGEDGSGLLLVLEDMHWIDAASRDMLERVVRAIFEIPVLVLLAYRSFGLAQNHSSETATGSTKTDAPGFETLPYFTCLRLTDLSPAQVDQALRAKLAQLYPEWRGAVPKALLEKIITQAQGNPFYAEELINYLHDRDLDLRDQAILEKLELPASLNSLVISRIDQLAASQQLTIKVSSVLGRLFRFEHLVGYYPDLGEQAQVHTDLNALSSLDLTPLETPEPELAYLFKHLITHDVAYELLPHATRERLHEQYAAFLEAHAGAETDQILDQLAFHYGRSANLPKKREYLVKAGVAAQWRYANEPALEYYRRALPLIPPEEQADVLLKLGSVLELVGKWDEADKAYSQALEQSGQNGEQAREGRCLAALAELDRKRGHYASAVERLEKAMEIFTMLNDLDGTAQVLHFQGTVLTHQGELQKAKERYEESLVIRRAQKDDAHAASLLSNLAIIAWIQDQYDQARTLNEEALALRRALGDKWAIATSLNNLGNVATDQGKYDEALRLHEEGLALRREVGDMWVVANSLNNLGNLYRSRGDYPNATTRYQESLKIVTEYNDRWAMAYLFEDMGCLSALQGQPERAYKLVGAAEALRQAIGSPRTQAEQQKLDAGLGPSRQALGDQAGISLDEGRRMTLEQAVEYAAGK
jgi:class 3 adenylate cyclase/predicted ATPase